MPPPKEPSLHFTGEEALEAEGPPGVTRQDWGRAGNCSPTPPRASSLAWPFSTGLSAFLGLPSGKGRHHPRQLLAWFCSGRGGGSVRVGSLLLQSDSELRPVRLGKGVPLGTWQALGEGAQRDQDTAVGLGTKGSSGTVEPRSSRELGHLGERSGHSHRKRTYQMVSFFSCGPNRGFSWARMAMSQKR